MEIRKVGLDEYEGFIAFINAGMRPDPAPTRAEDDFPVILGRDNVEGLWGARDAQGWVVGLAVLTRPVISTLGPIDVAGIGSVVTRNDRRGEGLNGRLQRAVLDDLARCGVLLAVLWTDRPEIYAGRGFSAAGWEYHLDLTGAVLSGRLPTAGRIRPYTHADLAAVSDLYENHPLRTVRRPGDAARLYRMPGTRGLVLDRGGEVAAYAFCGKGEDFPDYVAEWGGEVDAALTILAAARDAGLASRALVPAGREDLVEAAVGSGAGLALLPSGLWAVLRPDLIPSGGTVADSATMRDPRYWLGHIGADGVAEPGRLQLGIWGMDSV